MDRRGFFVGLFGLIGLASVPALATTSASPDTSLRWVNIKRLVMRVQSDLIDAYDFLRYEINDAVTRRTIEQITERYLSEFLDKRAIRDYTVIADERINSPNVIDSHRTLVDVYLRVDEMMFVAPLRFTITSSGVTSEVLQWSGW